MWQISKNSNIRRDHHWRSHIHVTCATFFFFFYKKNPSQISYTNRINYIHWSSENYNWSKDYSKLTDTHLHDVSNTVTVKKRAICKFMKQQTSRLTAPWSDNIWNIVHPSGYSRQDQKEWSCPKTSNAWVVRHWPENNCNVSTIMHSWIHWSPSTSKASWQWPSRLSTT